MEEMIRFVVFKNVGEVNVKVDSLEGLCFYFANNIKADLEMMEIPVFMYDINNGSGYHHYYLIAADYLIDPTYSQFLAKPNEKPIRFDDFPGNILKEDERGKVILKDLLENGYHKLSEGDIKIYLSGFQFKKERRK